METNFIFLFSSRISCLEELDFVEDSNLICVLFSFKYFSPKKGFFPHFFLKRITLRVLESSLGPFCRVLVGYSQILLLLLYLMDGLDRDLLVYR